MGWGGGGGGSVKASPPFLKRRVGAFYKDTTQAEPHESKLLSGGWGECGGSGGGVGVVRVGFAKEGGGGGEGGAGGGGGGGGGGPWFVCTARSVRYVPYGSCSRVGAV